MNEISINIGISLTEVKEQHDDLKPYEWRVLLRDQDWMGKICVQCNSPQAVLGIYNKIHGSRICMGGTSKSIDVASPTDPYLPLVPSPQARPMSSVAPS